MAGIALLVAGAVMFSVSQGVAEDRGIAVVAPTSDSMTCMQSAADPDASIPACTRLIDSEKDAQTLSKLLNNRGAAKFRKGDFTAAIEDFTKALDRNPKNIDSYLNRGLARQLLSDFDAAIADYNQGLRLNRRSAPLLNARGSALHSKGEYDLAIASFDQALAADKTFTKALLNRALARIYKRQIDAAIRDLDEYIQQRPNDVLGFTNRALARMDKGDLDGAIADNTQAATLQPNNWVPLSRRGEAYRMKGDLARALADHDAAIELGANAEAYNNRGFVWRDKGDLDAALRDFDSAILEDPNSAIAYANRGDTWRMKGNLARALADLDKAVRLDERSPYALTLRGNVYVATGDIDKAMSDFNRAINLFPDFVAAYTGRGEARSRKGDIAGAKADLQKATSLPAERDASIAKPAAARAVTLLAKIDEDQKSQAAAAAAAAAEKAQAAAASLDAVKAQQAKIEAAKAEAARLTAELARLSAERAEVARLASAQPNGVSRSKTPAAPSIITQLAPAGIGSEGSYFDTKLRADLQQPKLETVLGSDAQASVEPANLGVRVALVIGNSSYKDVPFLPNPVRDAKAVAEELRALGFETVISETDLPRAEFLTALHNFEEKAETADWAVIYYAGHGIEVGGTNYLIPTDAKLVDDRAVQDEAISLDRLLLATERARKLRLIILDACRENPFESKMRRRIASRSVGRGLARVEPETGTLVAYSARDGQVAADGAGANSPFTKAFLDNVSKPGVEINMLFRRIRDEVFNATGRKQEPFTYGSLPSENFYFSVRSAEARR